MVVAMGGRDLNKYFSVCFLVRFRYDQAAVGWCLRLSNGSHFRLEMFPFFVYVDFRFSKYFVYVGLVEAKLINSPI